MFEFNKSFLKNLYIYCIIGILVIVTCIFSAMIAFKMETHPIKLTTASFKSNTSTIRLKVPFAMEKDELFNVEKDIAIFVRDTTAYIGGNDDLLLHVYNATYRKDLLGETWAPNINDMAEVNMRDLKNNKRLRNVESAKHIIKIGNIEAIEVASRFSQSGKEMIQRIVHIPGKRSTWSVKAIYTEESGRMNGVVTDIFNSIVMEIPE